MQGWRAKLQRCGDNLSKKWQQFSENRTVPTSSVQLMHRSPSASRSSLWPPCCHRRTAPARAVRASRALLPYVSSVWTWPSLHPNARAARTLLSCRHRQTAKASRGSREPGLLAHRVVCLPCRITAHTARQAHRGHHCGLMLVTVARRLARLAQRSLLLSVSPAWTWPSLHPNVELHSRCFEVVTIERRQGARFAVACLLAHRALCLPCQITAPIARASRVDVSTVASLSSPSPSESRECVRAGPCCPKRTASAWPHCLPGCAVQSERRRLMSACWL
jgi:hypothetical protein